VRSNKKYVHTKVVWSEGEHKMVKLI